MRVVLDPNILVSALISSAGHSQQIVSAWVDGRFQLVVSPVLLAELSDVIMRSKFRRWVSQETAAEFVRALEDGALLVDLAPTRRRYRSSPRPGQGARLNHAAESQSAARRAARRFVRRILLRAWTASIRGRGGYRPIRPERVGDLMAAHGEIPMATSREVSVAACGIPMAAVV